MRRNTLNRTCMDKKHMSKRKFLMELIAIFTKIIRTVFFNLFMLGLGFILGFGTFKTVQHNIWKNKNQNYECVKRLDNKIDKEIEEIVIRATIKKEKEENNR